MCVQTTRTTMNIRLDDKNKALMRVLDISEEELKFIADFDGKLTEAFNVDMNVKLLQLQEFKRVEDKHEAEVIKFPEQHKAQ